MTDGKQRCSRYAQNCKVQCCDAYGQCPEYSGKACSHFYGKLENSHNEHNQPAVEPAQSAANELPKPLKRPFDESVWIIGWVLGGLASAMLLIIVYCLVIGKKRSTLPRQSIINNLDLLPPPQVTNQGPVLFPNQVPFVNQGPLRQTNFSPQLGFPGRQYVNPNFQPPVPNSVYFNRP